MSPQTPDPNHSMDAATGDGRPVDAWPPLPEELAAAAIHRAAVGNEAMPQSLAQKIAGDLVSRMDERGRDEQAAAGAPLPFAKPSGGRPTLPWALAAAVLILGSGGIVAIGSRLTERSAQLAETKGKLAAVEARAAMNDDLIAQSRVAIVNMQRDLAAKSGEVAERDRRLAEAASRNTDLAQQLADASVRGLRQSAELNEARLAIAKLEAPTDPAIATQNRQKLLEVPDSIRVAWAPFNLEGAPAAEQPGIQGDVVWNDRLETGFVRFVGLKPNDPKVEQYQVWVIDERGLEQKVSGGVFNANEAGEVIVPITPGIDVGRVALFAVTVEKPGGTWVPDLKRRLVVAPTS
ncbi:MAG: hypothetical protein ACOYN0_08945 [Phycisphaerales bacterium]